MLGVASDKSSDGRTFVYLYFTESTKADGEDERNGTKPLGNRLYKYELVGDKLLNPKMLLEIPSGRHSAHNGGKILIGPDHNLYLTVGDGDSCLDRFKKINGTYVCSTNNFEFILNSKSSNVKEGARPAGRGGILRMTVDGKTVGEGILGKHNPVNSTLHTE